MRLLGFAGFCLAALAQQPHENLNAVVWMQTAAEYRAAAIQTYRSAEASLTRALKDRNWTAALEQSGSYANLPPAIILDLDETVFDNSVFQARLTAANKNYSEEAWSGWVSEVRAGIVPGARAFLNMAHANGVALFYVTNRTCDASRADDPTVRMINVLHIPLSSGRLLCKGDPSDKSPRRTQIANRFRVLLLIGDDLNDFVTLPKEQSTVEGRADAVSAYERYWGDRWFLLPNPSYGSWERAVGTDVKGKFETLRQ